ncbi:MAG TPA: glycosyl hydrolase family 28 protein, partial [Bacteroidales bacterium]|nr:glycosyl hydrolase family 28 protein [Bacteroidales bacterium]
MMRKLILIIFLISPGLAGYNQTPVYNITDFGALGDGITDNTGAIQKAVNQCSQTGGKIVFPEGVFLSGTVFLESDITIELSAKAEWKGIPDLDAYPLIEPEMLSRMDLIPRRALVYAKNKTNITITGQGMFHPNGEDLVFQNHIGDSPDRPFGIQMVNCRNITLSGISMRNSAYWMQRYFHCDNLRFENLNIWNHSNLNNDGLDIDGCHKVVVTGCSIDASDDALVFKSEGLRTCEDVVVSNCILRSQASALKWGTGSVGGFKYVTVTNCVIRPSQSTIMHHPMGSWAGLVGIDMGNVDGGIMEHIVVNNIVVDSIETPIFIRLGKRNARTWAKEDSIHEGRTHDIRIDNISGTAAGKISCAITAYPGNYVEGVSLTNINLSFPGGGSKADVSRDVP